MGSLGRVCAVALMLAVCFPVLRFVVTDTKTACVSPKSGGETGTESDTAVPAEAETEVGADAADTVTRASLWDVFPAAYAERLASLSAAHPNWTFLPLYVTKKNAAYTLDFCVDAEYSVRARNVVPDTDAYAVYFDFDDTPLDTCHRAASRNAVADAMNPLGYLDEVSVFAFLDLSRSGDAGDVSRVTAGTWADTRDFREMLVRVGEKTGVSPVYLALRVRFEQGVCTPSATGNGSIGSALSRLTGGDFTAWDGYYNLLNIGASGRGTVEVLTNAALRAVRGTDGVAWTSPEASLLGGCGTLSQYLANGQVTPYLMKFNVDPDSERNFWGQTAQFLFAAREEARVLAQVYRDTDVDLTFLIPVF